MSSVSRPEPFRIIIPREAIESMDTEEVIMGLNVLARGKTTAIAALGNVQIHFDGYDDDPRELWQIPSVREYVAELDNACPFWLFLADLNSDTLFVITACLCRVTEAGLARSAFHPSDLQDFMIRQIKAMDNLWSLHGLPSGDQVGRALEANAYFRSRQILN